ncbi:PQQ-binding-like beta-propeller repeat protein [Gracilibacillus saliphilus]|uniref:outer membrane protein assembly factor BamB family protein n=1 Tax=Gracilibacillus saliphilus TaxID=543890 RepID=UPI0013D5DA95|nr:PQQ-binding-like beta-propeller repeat protein [Gracilibacillus saliphilus]
MKRIYSLLFMIVVLLLTACGEDNNAGSNNEGSSNSKNENEDVVTLNLYEENGNLNNLADVDHDFYEDNGVWDSSRVVYMDDEVAVYYEDVGLIAIDWKTGDVIWEDKYIPMGSGVSEVVNGYVYYHNEDESKYMKRSIYEDSTEEIDEDEYVFKAKTYYLSNKDENSIHYESVEEAGVVSIKATDKASGEVLWNKELSELDDDSNDITEIGDYVLILSSDVRTTYVLNSADGEVILEDDSYYDNGYQVDDKIYLVKNTSNSYIFYELDVNEGSVKEIKEFEDSHYDYNKIPHLALTGNVLTYHLHFGVLGINLDNGKYVEISSNEGDDVLDNHELVSIENNGNLYFVSTDDSDTILSIVNIENNEVISQYSLDNVMAYNREVAISKLNDQKFSIGTDEGIYVFNFSSFE